MRYVMGRSMREVERGAQLMYSLEIVCEQRRYEAGGGTWRAGKA